MSNNTPKPSVKKPVIVLFLLRVSDRAANRILRLDFLKKRSSSQRLQCPIQYSTMMLPKRERKKILANFEESDWSRHNPQKAKIPGSANKSDDLDDRGDGLADS